MIEAFQNINKAFESKVRLGIMAVLMVNEDADFNTLKELLSLTDGNLASHTRALEELHVGVFLPDFVQDSHIVKKQAAARIVEV